MLGEPHVPITRKCTYSMGHSCREPMPQVEVTFQGYLINSLDLGSWVVYSVRGFTPEPLQCFKCQTFGHIQKHCRHQELCSVCSSQHSTSESVSTLSAGNCKMSELQQGPPCVLKQCPVLLRRLPPGCTRWHKDPHHHVNTKPLPVAPLNVNQCSTHHRASPS